jgi:hypothetical protein
VRCAARTWLCRAMVSLRSRARSSVKRRKNGVKTDELPKTDPTSQIDNKQ